MQTILSYDEAQITVCKTLKANISYDEEQVLDHTSIYYAEEQVMVFQTEKANISCVEEQVLVL